MRDANDVKFGYILKQRSKQILDSVNLAQLIEAYPQVEGLWNKYQSEKQRSSPLRKRTIIA